tara:strand:+ start:1957 stop:3099 length:1143 start_codon:yes stop_codon:yes gene_type:complete
MSFIGIGSPIPEIANLPGQGGAIEVLLDYSNAAVCNDAATQSPTYSPSGGVFSASPSGLNINTSDGIITPTGSTPNTYTITYTVSGESSSFTFTINPIQQSTFSYSSSSLEQYGTASPIFASGTTTGGTFSATSGLVINTTTGVLDLANSTIGGPYTVTYTTPGPCATSSTFNVSVTALSTSLVDNNFALSFNGTDEYVNAGSATELQMTGDVSISAWFKTSVTGTQKQIVTRGPDWVMNGWSLFVRSNNQVAIMLNTSGNPLATSSSTVTDGQWHHVVGVRDSSGGTGSLKIYLDGVEAGSADGGTDAMPNGSEVWIGSGTNGGSKMTGDIDEVAIWNTALELADVQRIYNGSSTSGKATNLFSTGLSNGLVYWNRMGD